MRGGNWCWPCFSPEPVLANFEGPGVFRVGVLFRTTTQLAQNCCQDRLGTNRTNVFFFMFLCFLFFLLRRVLLGSAVAMGGLRLALEKLRRPSRPHQQAEV